MFSLFLLSFMIMISALTRNGQDVDVGILHLVRRQCNSATVQQCNIV
jgi:hypothetical protein